MSYVLGFASQGRRGLAVAPVCLVLLLIVIGGVACAPTGPASPSTSTGPAAATQSVASVAPTATTDPSATAVRSSTTASARPTSSTSPTAAPVATTQPTATTAPSPASKPRPIQIVAAENFYGDLATQIGGDRVTVVSILKDPSVDPHEYESNVDDAKAVADARIVIKNGVGYDAFVDKLLSASPRPQRVVIDVGQLTGHHSGDNPHLWYEPTTMPKVARKLSDVLTRLDPADKDYFSRRLQAFNTSEKAVDDRIAALKDRYAGTKVLPTEPVFDYMAEALGLSIVDQEGAFQKAVEEGNDPPASAVAEFRRQIASHTIKALIYNSQAVTPITTQMLDYAKQNGVPVIPVSETEPTGKTYQQWMLDQLASVQKAFGGQ